VSRRGLIKMTAEEAQAFLAEQMTITCATNGRDGFPHLMPLWYVLRDGRIWAWTYAKSQKVKNLERDPRATLQVETGRDYAELRGVMLRCDVTIHRDVDVVTDFAMELVERYAPGAEGTREAFAKQAPKRVALEFVERDRVTWDHRKLGGTY
jgi:PPOX class probable F420-dependent enzyme